MRRENAMLGLGILILFLLHGIAGAFQLFGVFPGGKAWFSRVSWALLALLAVHALISLKLTWDSIQIGRRTGVWYFRENMLFWIRRISGLAILLFAVCHLLIFLGDSSGASYRLQLFAEPQLLTQILLVITIAVHLLTNFRPLLISFGIFGFRIYVKDLLLILAVVLFFLAAAFVFYYMRWNLIWR